jgi:hypothetical protein
MQLFASPTNTVFQTRQTEKISNKANQTARWFSPSLDSVSFSASSASPTSIHFGNTSPSTDDTAAIELMEALLPRLSEARNWQVKHHLDCFGGTLIGRDLDFTLGDTRYTLRDIYDYPNIPLGMKKGTVLISEDASRKQEYPIGKESVFYKFKSQFMQVASPILGKALIDKIVSRIDQLTVPSYYGYMGTQNAKGTLSFYINGEEYSLSVDPANGNYTLREMPKFSDQELESFWSARKVKYTLENAEENLRNLSSLEKFKAGFSKFQQSIEHKLTPELNRQLFDAVKGPIGELFLQEFGIGLDFNPRPFIRSISNRLLNDCQNTRLDYTDHHHIDEMRYFPGQTPPGNDIWNELYFEISKYPLLDSSIHRYEISSSCGRKGKIRFEVLNDEDTAILDDIMAISKLKSLLYTIALIESPTHEPSLGQLLNTKKQNLQENQAILLANLAAKLAALTD